MPQYNGNISEFDYNSPNMAQNAGQSGTYINHVGYTYDNLNRLLQSSSDLQKNDERVVYDNMGNIDTLVRSGNAPGSYIGTLAYNYNTQSNQLSHVNLNGSSTALKTFQYDGNGNATKTDTNKTIVYNRLNLPMQVNVPGLMLATYFYDAAGNKLRNVSNAGGTWYYQDGIVYQNGRIQLIQTEEGEARLSSDSLTYKYNSELKDYLGNVRASYDNGGTGGTARLIQENEYFPFGLTTKYYDFGNGNRYLYNSKELQTDLTEQYDYGARFYDPVIARFDQVDPLADKYPWYTQYQFAGNEVPNAIDRDGMEPAYPNGDGTYTMARDGDLKKPLTDPKGIAYLNSKNQIGGADKVWDGMTEGLNNTGTAFQVAGYLLAIPTDGLSLTLVGYGETLDAAGATSSVTHDLSQGKTGSALLTAASAVAFGTVGKKFEGLEKSGAITKVQKTILGALTTTTSKLTDKALDKAKEKLTDVKSDGKIAITNTQTMQQDHTIKQQPLTSK